MHHRKLLAFSAILAAVVTEGASGVDYSTAEVFRELRAQALQLKANDAGLKGSTFGLLMETGYPEAVVTLVALSDGTASLYFSNGGGIIGAGQHERPATAARSLVAFAAHNLGHLSKATDFPLPRPSHTRFYALTETGVLTAEVVETDLGENRHVLSPLFHAAHALIAEMREIEERRK